jgi:hypothetical protein
MQRRRRLSGTSCGRERAVSPPSPLVFLPQPRLSHSPHLTRLSAHSNLILAALRSFPPSPRRPQAPPRAAVRNSRRAPCWIGSTLAPFAYSLRACGHGSDVWARACEAGKEESFAEPSLRGVKEQDVGSEATAFCRRERALHIVVKIASVEIPREVCP